MDNEILGVVVQVVLAILMAYPLGKYIAKVYKGKKSCLDFMKPVERWMFRLSGIDPEREMNWKQFLRALLTVNLFWFIWGDHAHGTRYIAAQSRRQRRADGTPGFQYMHQFSS